MQSLKNFELYLLRQGKSQGTVQKHIASLSNLQKSLGSLDVDEIEQHILSMIKKGYSPGHINNLVQALRHYGTFINDDCYKKIGYMPLKETHKATMSDAEIEAFLKLPPGKNFNVPLYTMFSLYFKILAYSGMRPNEVACLTIESVDFGRRVFDLTKTKTNTPRLVPIAPSLIDDLTAYTRDCPRQLFLRNGTTISRDTWKNQFRSRIKRLGIVRKNLTTNSLRHSFITRMLSEDVNMFKVQRIVGHKKIETTNHYTHLITKDLTIAIAKDPLARQSLPYEERFKQFREGVRLLLDSFTLSVEEEKQMIRDL